MLDDTSPIKTIWRFAKITTAVQWHTMAGGLVLFFIIFFYKFKKKKKQKAKLKKVKKKKSKAKLFYIVRNGFFNF